MTHLDLTFASGETSLTVTRFAVEEAVSTLFTVSVWALSEDPSIDLEALVGRPAAFRIDSGATAAPLGGRRSWTGLCEHAALLKAEPTGSSAYFFRVVPTLWLLTQRRNHRIFQHLSIPDIVDRILAGWSLTPVWRIDRAAYPRLEYKAQYGESDHDFLSRLLEEAGIAYTFPEDEAHGSRVTFDDALHAGAPRAAPPIRYTDDLGSMVGGERITEVHLGHDVKPGAQVVRDFDLRNPSFPLFGQAAKAPAPEDRYEQFEYRPGSFLAASTGPAGTPAADDKGPYRRDETRGNAVAGRGLEAERVDKRAVSFGTNTVDLWPGAVFSVEDHPHAEIAGGQTLLVTAFSLDGAHGEAWRMSGRAVFTAAPHRPSRRTPKPRVRGVQSALVVGRAGEEIHTDEFGRVRVQFPWDREGTNDDDSSVWMRVSQAWAGAGYGMITLPRVGQEVLVGFLDGDPDQPIVVGRLFNAQSPVPYGLPENRTRSTFKTDTSPGSGGFNEILLEDLAGSELVYQQAQKNLRRLVKRDETITVVRDRSKTVDGDETDTTVGERVEETDKNRIEEIDGDRTTAVRKKSATLVKKDRIERTEGDRIVRVGKDLHVLVRKTKRELVGRDLHLEVEGSYNESFGGYSLSTGTQQEKIGKKNELETGLAIHEKAGTVLVAEGASSVTIKGPGGFITIGPGGIAIVGTLVKINEGGSPGSAPDAKPAGPERPREAEVIPPRTLPTS